MDECCICYDEKKSTKVVQICKQIGLDLCNNDFKCFENVCDDCLIKYISQEVKSCFFPSYKKCIFCRSTTFIPLGVIYLAFDDFIYVQCALDKISDDLKSYDMYDSDKKYYSSNIEILKYVLHDLKLSFYNYVISYKYEKDKYKKIKNIRKMVNRNILKFSDIRFEINFTKCICDTLLEEIEEDVEKVKNEDFLMDVAFLFV